jgi:hypothetical protein
VVLVSLAVLVSCGGQGTKPATTLTPAPSAATAGSIAPVASTSAAPKPLVLTENEAMKGALVLARSADAKDHDALLAKLASTTFLNELDGEDVFGKYPPRFSRLWGVLKALMKNVAPSAKQVLVRLSTTKSFSAQDPRDELLVQALEVVRPSPPEVIKFWEAHAVSDSTSLHFVIDALIENGSETAIALFEKRMAATDLPPELKIAWMHDAVLRHRHDPTLLRACQRLLTKSLPASLRVNLVESLFDHRPDEWYNPGKAPSREAWPEWARDDPDRGETPRPPERATASKEAKALLRAMGELALSKIPLGAALEKVVKKALKELA